MNTLQTSALVIALGSMALSTACNDDNGDNVVAPNDAGSGSNQDGGAQSDAGQVRTDGQIAAVVTTANTGEVAQGRVALTKAEDAQVRAFAQQMVTEHTAAQQSLTQVLTTAGITPQPNEVSRSLKSESDQVVQQLNTTAAGPEFDSAYIQSQVAVHQKVLDLLDNELIPAAQDGTLRDELQTTSDAVAEHLAKAKDLAGNLDAGVGDGGAGDGGADAGGDGGRPGGSAARDAGPRDGRGAPATGY